MYAFHGIFSAYGFWLPNDPRGSWSAWVARWELFRYGPATKLATRRSVAGAVHDQQLRLRTKQSLQHPPVRFDGLQAKAIAQGCSNAASASAYGVHALAIMPDHVHVVIAASQRRPNQVVGHLKAAATKQLTASGMHPFAHHGVLTRSCWADQCWTVYLDTHEQVDRAVRYVENNPIKEGLRRQAWRCVLPYDRTTAVSRRA